MMLARDKRKLWRKLKQKQMPRLKLAVKSKVKRKKRPSLILTQKHLNLSKKSCDKHIEYSK